MKVHAYYQTFIDIPQDVVEKVDHFIVSSIHFDLASDGKPATIHLNDNHPDSSVFDKMWENVEAWSKIPGKHVSLMIGGAGGAYQSLFKDYNVFYSMLLKQLKKRPYITGIVFDVEEMISLSYLQNFIDDISTLIPKYTLYASPCQYCLAPPSIGMGGFNYKDVKNIDIFLVQAYCNFSYDVLCKIDRYWKDKKIILGLLTGTVPLDKLKTVTEKMSNVVLWELGSAEGIEWVRSV